MEDPFGLEDTEEVHFEDFPDEGWDEELADAGEQADVGLHGGQAGNVLADGHDVESTR